METNNYTLLSTILLTLGEKNLSGGAVYSGQSTTEELDSLLNGLCADAISKVAAMCKNLTTGEVLMYWELYENGYVMSQWHSKIEV